MPSRACAETRLSGQFGADIRSFDDLTTAGVLLTPRGDGQRPWATTFCMVEGDLELSDEEVTQMIDFWGIAGLANLTDDD